MTLKKAKMTQTHAGIPSLIEIAEHLMGKTEPGRPFSTIHASMLTNEKKRFCPREVALSDITGNAPKGEYISATLKATFDVGWQIHHLMTDNWLRQIAVGNWRCPRCEQASGWGPYPEDGFCLHCASSHRKWIYLEANFVHTDTKISGSIDLIVDLGLEKLIPVEIKSIDKDQFKDLVAPLAEHRVRSQLYLDLIKNSNHLQAHKVSHKLAKIIYVSKGYGAKNSNGKISPFREFNVQANEKAIAPYLAMGEKVVHWRTQGVMPAGVCPNSFGPRVSSCSCPKECFSGHYPAGMTVAP